MLRIAPSLLLVAFFPTTPASAQPGALPPVEKDHLPYRKHAVLPGKVVGLMVAKGQPILSTEGRSGPQDQVCFAADGNSYRWVYVPTFRKPRITNLQVPVGNQGEIDIYPSLDMANPKALAGWGLKEPVSLVEVEVNQGKGSPAIDSFVGTNFRLLEGTKEYPLRLVEVVGEAEKRFAAYLKDRQPLLDKAIDKVRKTALPDGGQATGPRTTEKLTFLTWHSKRDILEVRFRGTLRDGSFRTIRGGGIETFPLPVLPPKGKLPLPPVAPGGRTAGDSPELSFVAFPPPQPQPFEMRVGTAFGIHYGLICEFDRHGKLVAERPLPILEFVIPEQLPPGGPGIRPRPLPPRPKG